MKPRFALAGIWRAAVAACDSPTLAPDIASMLSSFRVGLWFLLLNGALGLFMCFAVAASIFGNSPVGASLGLGKYLCCTLMATLGGLITLLIPLRTSGLLEGPRWSRFFDQIILTGISPLRYFSGKLLAVNLFFVIMLAAALPYLIFCLGLEGADWLYLGKSLLALLVYVNFLALGTLLASMYVNEVAAVLLVIGGVGISYIVSVSSPAAFSSLSTPGHFFVGPLIEEWALRYSSSIGVTATAFDLGGNTYTVSDFQWFLLSTLPLLPLFAFLLLLGPVLGLARANSTFGEIVMKGDNRKRALFRKRFALRRRSELCFFYENRSPWLTRWELPIRYGFLLGSLLLLLLVSYASLYVLAQTTISPWEFIGFSLFTAVNALLIAAFVFSTDRGTECARVRMGKYSCSVGGLDTVCFLIFLGAVVFCLKGLPYLYELWNGEGSMTQLFGKYKYTYSFYGEWNKVMSVIHLPALLALETYVFVRVVSMRSWNRLGAVIGGSLTIALLWVPIYGLCYALADYAASFDLVDVLRAVAATTPVPYIFNHVNPEWVARSHEGGLICGGDYYHFTIPFHLVLTALLAKLGLYLHRRYEREDAPHPPENTKELLAEGRGEGEILREMLGESPQAPGSGEGGAKP